MWIRSQNKEEIVKCYGASIVHNNNDMFSLLSVLTNNYTIALGEYSTKEKALKVLDKIVAQMETCTETRTQIKPYSNGSDWDTCERVATVVFQMPQDDEV
ncbi:hypothetical protein [Candidatus Stoquefichus sp. SB1]|uniref:hypothetical protein n=1 Tax=Candidatus Stoquefichus sp. SB1 TaxID=1658109 RepID=UPI00067E9C7F|nr:hypothetical protein [Candidatus Stoquefichus sp. SB1]